jgi:hypothetical protein
VRDFGSRGVEAVWDPLRAVAAVWGLHLCCRVPWELVGRAEPDLLSFDLTLEHLSEAAVAVLRQVTGRGGRVACGSIAAHRRESLAVTLGQLRSMSERTGIVPGATLLTPACGTGRVSGAREREIAAQLRMIATRMRESEWERQVIPTGM